MGSKLPGKIAMVILCDHSVQFRIVCNNHVNYSSLYCVFPNSELAAIVLPGCRSSMSITCRRAANTDSGS
jgi:hypothetical protein